nr:hypothetical protein [uncultured bacterium]
MNFIVSVFTVLAAFASESPQAPFNLAACRNFYPPDGPFYHGEVKGSPRAPDRPLRVVSYNVNFAKDMKNLLTDFSKVPTLAGADVVLLQEVEGHPGANDSAARVFAKLLGMSYVFAPAEVFTKHKADYGNAILSRFPITRWRKIVLPLSNFEDCNQRIALQATIDVDGRELELFSVHLSTLFKDSAGKEPSRARQLAPVMEAVDQVPAGRPILITGDLNTVNPFGWWAVRKLTRAHGLKDAHLQDVQTFRIPPFHLDHMFSRGLCTVKAGVEKDAEGSDHYPIWSELTVDGGNDQCPAQQ